MPLIAVPARQAYSAQEAGEQFLAAIHSPTESDRPVDRGGLRVASAGSRNVRPKGALFTIIFPAVPGLWVIVAKVQ